MKFAVGSVVQIHTGVHAGKTGAVVEPPYAGCDYYVSVGSDIAGPFVESELAPALDEAMLDYLLQGGGLL